MLHDTRMDARSPTHEVTRAQAVLRTRRKIAGAVLEWALSQDGLKICAATATAGRDPGRGGDGVDEAREASGDADADPLKDGLAAIDRTLERNAKILARAKLRRGPLIYDWIARRAKGSWLGGDFMERLGNKPAARAPGVARQFTDLGDASGAAKNPVASFLREFRSAPRPPRETPIPRLGDAAWRLPRGDRGGGGDGRPRSLAARPAELGGHAHRPPLHLPAAHLGRVHPA